MLWEGTENRLWLTTKPYLPRGYAISNATRPVHACVPTRFLSIAQPRLGLRYCLLGRFDKTGAEQFFVDLADAGAVKLVDSLEPIQLGVAGDAVRVKAGAYLDEAERKLDLAA
ncbi:hypothetical protein [Rhodanobacter sp. A1T4]|uniref:hypothetical protein n=1 Tax=Rhodanobacter sp. A1T4 TaxID=2723087 RepID=UPI00161F4006|nr:hypothetical protein [Rhodanobacter sp. A1T4]MBB6247223.1 hypothetical protein [Rhodanobacter sp. A1T4]